MKVNFTLYSGQSLKMNGLTSFLVAFSFPWHAWWKDEVWNTDSQKTQSGKDRSVYFII